MEGKENAGTETAWPYGANGALVAALLSEGFEIRPAKSAGWAVVAAKRGRTVRIEQRSPRSGMMIDGRTAGSRAKALEAVLGKIAGPEAPDIDARLMSCVERVFERRGAKIVGRKWDCPSGRFDLVVDEGNRIAFVYVRVSDHAGAFEADLPDLPIEDREACMLRWNEEHPTAPCTALEFDVVIVCPTASRALIKHQTNAYRGIGAGVQTREQDGISARDLCPDEEIFRTLRRK